MKIIMKSRTGIPVPPSNTQSTNLALLRHKCKQTRIDIQTFLKSIDEFESKSRKMNHMIVDRPSPKSLPKIEEIQGTFNWDI
jgi:hypothetical protein